MYVPVIVVFPSSAARARQSLIGCLQWVKGQTAADVSVSGDVTAVVRFADTSEVNFGAGNRFTSRDGARHGQDVTSIRHVPVVVVVNHGSGYRGIWRRRQANSLYSYVPLVSRVSGNFLCELTV